eukprot:gene25903-30971_t
MLNGAVSVAELRANLGRSKKYAPFVAWLTAGRRFQSYDSDATGTIEMPELVSAVAEWRAAQPRGRGDAAVGGEPRPRAESAPLSGSLRDGGGSPQKK